MRLSLEGKSLKHLDFLTKFVREFPRIQHIDLNNNAISNIETRLPTLEKEKKLAATARNFKEAARLAKEVKAMQADEQSKAAKRDQIKDELEGVTKEVDAKTAERNQKKAKLEQAERQVELDQLETVKADFLQVWREELVLEYPK